MADDNSLTGRVKRYAKVGTTIGGFAARTVGGRLFGLTLDRAEHAADLQRVLGGLKGPLMKVARLL
ncbi:MAG: AarF/ABC1/UbiB kinase family protein, partial [Proteobacteria bacterium]|nr:AarF/ABC1/UbiB kinase family protein [Pseudomonadota bacterium]